MHFLGKSPLSYNLFISIDLVIRRVLSVMRCVFVVLFKEAEPKKKKKKRFSGSLAMEITVLTVSKGQQRTVNCNFRSN